MHKRPFDRFDLYKLHVYFNKYFSVTYYIIKINENALVSFVKSNLSFPENVFMKHSCVCPTK